MDEQLRILKMIEEGTITAEQGAELMSAMNTDPQELQTAAPKSRSSYEKKMFRILEMCIRDRYRLGPHRFPLPVRSGTE